ncbi:hypothetical protein [uncultured Methanolobus sp.]|uniref:hypothetical protein n=1 Tax=uncultured Methanolobus sp. TaxID=218300 RepID=UPI0029C6558C|nr:hypothetical protein [uncultured Methanolobus sp.]
MAQYKAVVLSHLEEHGPASIEDLFTITGHYDIRIFRNIIYASRKSCCIVSEGKPAQYSITDSGIEWLDEWEALQQRKVEKEANRRVFYPIKDVVLPALLEKSMTLEALFAISSHPDFSRFRGGLTRLEQRGFLTIDRTSVPWLYSLSDTDRARAHALDSGKGIREGVEKKQKMFSGYAQAADGTKKPVKVKVKVRKVPAPVMMKPPEPVMIKPEAPVKQSEPVKYTPGTVESRILAIIVREGGITTDELYSLAKEHDDVMKGYAVVKGHITKMMSSGMLKIDLSTEPIMYFTTPQGESFIQNQCAEVES